MAKLPVAFLLAAAAAHAAGIEATLKPDASVAGTWITLGEVADLAGDGAEAAGTLKLARAPMAGAVRHLTADEVAAALARQGGADGVTVSREVPACRVTARPRMVPGRDLVAFGRTFLAARAAVPGGDVRIEDPATPRAVAVPEGEPELRADAPARRLLGLVPVAVEVWAGERRLARLLLSYRVRATGPVVRAARALKAGETLRADDVTAETVDLSGAPEDALTDPEAAVGRTVVRETPAGAVLRRESVIRAAAVKRGAPVTLLARVGAVEARAAATSREDGAPGEVITVQNLNSKRLVKARVLDDAQVEAVVR